MWNTRRYSYEDQEYNVDQDSVGYPNGAASPRKTRMQSKRNRNTKTRFALATGGGLCLIALVAVFVTVMLVLKKEGQSL